MAYTLDTTFGELLADPRAKAVMDQYLPGVSSNPMIDMVKSSSLRALISMPQVAMLGITQEKVQAILDEVNKRVA